MLKKTLYLFGLVALVLGLAIALVIALKAPPAEEHIGGILYIWNGAERREAMLQAWKVGFLGVGSGLLFLALGTILDRLERIQASLRA